jgi:hypothetical protein
MSISDYAENAVLNLIARNTAFTTASGVWVKLHTGDPTDVGTASPATETTRKQATFGTAASGTGGTISTTADLVWTNVSAGAGETYTHISLWDASTAGNPLWTGALNAPKTVSTGDTFQILTGNLTLTLD